MKFNCMLRFDLDPKPLINNTKTMQVQYNFFVDQSPTANDNLQIDEYENFKGEP